MLENLINHVVTVPRIHAAWLNTFSYLEYVGFRKIVKSQKTMSMSSELLEHALEEGRHALRLKKEAVRIGGPEFDRYVPNLMLGLAEGKNYFQKLDQYCADVIGDDAYLTYLYVTLNVELRALEVYQLYYNILNKTSSGLFLKALLVEETQHLEHVQSELASKDPWFLIRQKDISLYEERLFANFVGALKEEVLPHDLHA